MAHRVPDRSLGLLAVCDKQSVLAFTGIICTGLIGRYHLDNIVAYIVPVLVCHIHKSAALDEERVNIERYRLTYVDKLVLGLFKTLFRHELLFKKLLARAESAVLYPDIDISKYMNNDAVKSVTTQTDDTASQEPETQPLTIDDVKEKSLYSIIPNETMDVAIQVSESDVNKLENGMKAKVVLNSDMEKELEGTVSKISGKGDYSSGNTKFTVLITIDRSENMLPGMSANIELDVGSISDENVVPVEAVSEVDGKAMIYTSYDEAKDELGDPVEVEIGLSDGVTCAVESGIEPGTKIWYKSLNKIIKLKNNTSLFGI